MPVTDRDDLRQRILNCERKYNWDGAGAKAIQKSTCEAAVQFVIQIQTKNPHIKPPRVSVSPRGGVTLTWSLNNYHFTARLTAALSPRVEYQWEDSDFNYGSGADSLDGISSRLEILYQDAASCPPRLDERTRMANGEAV